MNVGGTMRSRALLGEIDPAFELAAVESAVARAVGGETFRDAVIFQHGGGGDDFENGAGRELGLNCAIEQRVERIVVELLPFLRGDANCKIVGIGSGAADHG